MGGNEGSMHTAIDQFEIAFDDIEFFIQIAIIARPAQTWPENIVTFEEEPAIRLDHLIQLDDVGLEIHAHPAVNRAVIGERKDRVILVLRLPGFDVGDGKADIAHAFVGGGGSTDLDHERIELNGVNLPDLVSDGERQKSRIGPKVQYQIVCRQQV